MRHEVRLQSDVSINAVLLGIQLAKGLWALRWLATTIAATVIGSIIAVSGVWMGTIPTVTLLIILGVVALAAILLMVDQILGADTSERPLMRREPF
ncbi:MAG TPA: hypothetical protein VLE51_03530 [Candidatus Saccharimonadales bacterium]|nr:hypothetical protein [Candidatus Saccharimonadales bacterium]